ncbi:MULTISPECIES: tape measure protein [unclassified Brucella]|uniref:tape measure protein n=1 Tax=unclassified Brucella TaxID=2632610 RepID=UPI001FFFD258|nr:MULTISPECIES: tape measure protein [unclassified Brucella]
MTVPYEYKRIPLYLIDIPEGRIRRQRAERVETLAKDIAVQGQLQPIVVVATEDGRFSLDDGALRVAALRQNKADEIDARVTPISWLKPQERRLREIMINLNREPYTALEEGEALAELKEVYEALYPDTRKGVAGGKARQKSATEIFSFAAAAAEATGLSDRAIRMAVAMVNGLSSETKQRVRGTSVERKAYASVKAGAKAAGQATVALHQKTVALAKAGIGNIGEGSGKVLRGVGLAAGAATVAFGVSALAANQLVGSASKFEKFQTILETTEGSSAKAKTAMGWVTDFAVKTPYELDQVMDSFVQLRARGLDPTNGLLMALGDTSAAMGVPLMQGVEAMADAVTGENERLKAFGITASKSGGLISYSYTNSAGKMMEATVKATDRIGIQAKLMEIFNEKYGGAMDKLSRTWEGMISNIADIWLKFQLAIMNAGLFDWMKGKLQMVLNTINQMQDSGQLEKWAARIGESIQFVLEGAWSFATGVFEVLQKLGSYLSTAKDYVGSWERLAAILGALAFAPVLISTAAGIVQIAMGLSMLSTALLANPIVLAIAGIVGGAVLIYRNWDGITAFFGNIWNSISAGATALWDKLKGLLGFDPLSMLKTAFAWSPVGLVIQNWGSIQSTIQGFISAIPGIVTGAWDLVKTAFSWTPTGLIIQNWDGISGAASAAVQKVFQAVDGVWTSIKSVFDWVPTETINAAWAGISDTIGGLIDGATSRVANAWNKVKSVFTFGGGETEAKVNVTDPATILAATEATSRLNADICAPKRNGRPAGS